jgi:hypothetical protein
LKVWILRTYFQLLTSVWGEVYFRVSKHLGVSIIEVIKNKFMIEYKTLIIYYNHQVRAEIEEQEKLEEEKRKLKR